MGDTHYQKLIAHVANLEEEEAIALVKELLLQKEDPLTIIGMCKKGMQQVGKAYERGDYFLSGLIMAGEIFRQVTEIIQPEVKKQGNDQVSGSILIGTVQGDIHDIGKNIVSMLLTCTGFTVHDIGVDVPAEKFIEQAEMIKPQIIGLSGLLTAAIEPMRQTVQQILTAGPDRFPRPRIIIGGSMVDEQVRSYTGADYSVSDAVEGVDLCRLLVPEIS